MWPTLKASELCDSVYVDFIEQLQRCKDRIPPSDRGLSVDSIIADVVRLVIQQSKFVPYTSESPAYHHYLSFSASNVNQNRAKTLELLRLCTNTSNRPLCTLVLQRLLDSSLHSREYIENVLVPFIPQLHLYLTTSGIALSEPPFNSAFKSIIMLWANKVLGPKPSEVADTVLSRMRNHACKCAQCKEAFKFLTKSGSEKTYSLPWISAERDHLERQLTKYVPRTAATWAIIQSSQGLTVRMLLPQCLIFA